MQSHELDLVVGEVLRIGEFTVTVVDIDDGAVTFRVEETEENSETSSPPTTRPR